MNSEPSRANFSLHLPFVTYRVEGQGPLAVSLVASPSERCSFGARSWPHARHRLEACYCSTRPSFAVEVNKFGMGVFYSLGQQCPMNTITKTVSKVNGDKVS